MPRRNSKNSKNSKNIKSSKKNAPVEVNDLTIEIPENKNKEITQEQIEQVTEQVTEEVTTNLEEAKKELEKAEKLRKSWGTQLKIPFE